jgi:hypothetical protein
LKKLKIVEKKNPIKSYFDMSFDPTRHSIISSSQSQASSVNPSNPNRNYNQPLINSAVVSNGTNDEKIAQMEQERLYFESLMDVDEPSAATGTAAASFDTRTLEEIEADATFARKLQEEEYSRNSIVPTRSYQQGSNRHRPPPYVVDPYGPQVFGDAELAAQLQAEENKKQQRQRHRPPTPSQQRTTQPTTNRNDEPEVIPFPFLTEPRPQRPSSSRNNNRDTTDLSPFMRIFAPRGRFPGLRRSGGRGAHSIQNTTEDFGPDDYENLLELDNAVSVGNQPLTTEQINRLPTENFRRPATRNDEENKCNICWDQFEQNQTLRRLPCLHLYHSDCIDPWLKRSNACPICRMPPIK